MSNGNTTGTRALVDNLQTRAYCQATLQQGFAVELFSDLQATELDDLVSQADQLAAAKQTSRYRSELTDVFCLRRDLRYGLRSRRWLFSKAEQTKLIEGQVEWTTFVRENLDNAYYLRTLIPKNSLELTELDLATVLKGG
jgi:hypothetical protein